jgi:hypothetical protein
MSPLTFNYGGVKIQEVINQQYRFSSQQQELEIGQHILLDNFWSMRFHPQNLEIGQEKLVRALEQEFVIKNRAFMQAAEQHRKTLAEMAALRDNYDKLLAEHEKFSAEHEDTLKSIASMSIQNNKLEEQLSKAKGKHILQEVNKPTNSRHEAMSIFVRAIGLADNSRWSASIMEQTSTNPNFIQAIARERLRCHSAKFRFCEYEKAQHETLQLALQTLFLSLLVNPAPGIEIISNSFYLRQPAKKPDEKDKIVKFTILLAYLNMSNYRELHIQHKNKTIPVTPGLILEHGFLANIYVKSLRHIQSFPAKLANTIQFYLSLWEEVSITIDSIPPEFYDNIIYPDPAVHNIILEKKSYASPPLAPGPIPLPTIADIQQFRGVQIVQHEELWNDSHLFMVLQDKYMTIYAARQTERPLNYIIGGPTPKIRMAKGSLTEQAQEVVSEEYSRLPPEDAAVEDAPEDDTDYWNNLDEVELHNIENMMEP